MALVELFFARPGSRALGKAPEAEASQISISSSESKQVEQ
jgi:hypothetical protein